MQLGEALEAMARRAHVSAEERAILEAAARRLGPNVPRQAAGGAVTRAVHAGEEVAAARPTVAPIHPSVSYAFESAADLEAFLGDQENGFIYGRWRNPAVVAAERKVAALAGVEEVRLATAGMGAISATLLALVEAGQEVLALHGLYGEAQKLIRETLPRFGVKTRFIEVDAARDLGPHLRPETRVFYGETLTNPMLRVPDIGAAAAACRAAGVMTVVDNTMATPFHARPIEWGADLVLESATKAIAGHGDVLAGAVYGRADLLAAVDRTMRRIGVRAAPFEAFLVARGAKTFPLRAARQAASAARIADWLAARPEVRRVRYPGRADHPDHDLALRRFRGGFGGMVTFDLGSLDAARRFFDGLGLVRRAASLGAVESLVSLPVLSSHWGLAADVLAASDISPGTVRLSVGIEDAEDIIADIERALAAAEGAGA